MRSDARLQLINAERATMIEVAELAQAGGVAVVERGGEFAFCDRKQIPSGWKRCAIGAVDRKALAKVAA